MLGSIVCIDSRFLAANGKYGQCVACTSAHTACFFAGPPEFNSGCFDTNTVTLTQLVKQEGNPLDYGKIKTAEQILANTNVLESINVDEEAIQFYLDYSIDELWKSAFRDKENTIAGVKKRR